MVFGHSVRVAEGVLTETLEPSDPHLFVAGSTSSAVLLRVHLFALDFLFVLLQLADVGFFLGAFRDLLVAGRAVVIELRVGIKLGAETALLCVVLYQDSLHY